MSRIEEFEELRSVLFSIAYCVLGSSSEAHNAVEETWLRYEAATTEPASVGTFLSAEVTRISIGILHSARVRQEKYAEPLLNDPSQNPECQAELTAPRSTAAVLLLERLSPPERAVFVLCKIFACSVPQIASAMGCSEEACQQLAASVSTLHDNGDRALPWPGYIVGANHVARFWAAIGPALNRIGVTMQSQNVGIGPGALFRDRNGTVLGAVEFGFRDEKIQKIRVVAGPNGLGY